MKLPCRRCSWPRPARSTPAPRWPPAGRPVAGERDASDRRRAARPRRTRPGPHDGGSGQAITGMPRTTAALVPGQPSQRSMMAIVRLALVTSVTCDPPLTPPVKVPDQPGVGLPEEPPRRFSAASARRRRCRGSTGSCRRRSRWPAGRPALRRMTSPLPRVPAALAMRSVRVSFQTDGVCIGNALVRLFPHPPSSQWLVMPSAARSPPTGRAGSWPSGSPSWSAPDLDRLCSTQPARGRICSCSSWCLATSAPS